MITSDVVWRHDDVTVRDALWRHRDVRLRHSYMC